VRPGVPTHDGTFSNNVVELLRVLGQFTFRTEAAPPALTSLTYASSSWHSPICESPS
jgi:hypothetical protein